MGGRRRVGVGGCTERRTPDFKATAGFVRSRGQGPAAGQLPPAFGEVGRAVSFQVSSSGQSESRESLGAGTENKPPAPSPKLRNGILYHLGILCGKDDSRWAVRPESWVFFQPRCPRTPLIICKMGLILSGRPSRVIGRDVVESEQSL